MSNMKERYTEIDDAWSFLVDNEFFTQAELELLTSINGYNMDTLNDALYARYGYRDIEQMEEEYGVI